MTDREKAIVMAYTEICMLTGDKFQIFHKYIEDILGRPVMTHELAFLADVIKKRSKADFIELCKDGSDSIKALQQESCDDCISRQAVIDKTGLSEWFDVLDKIKAEILDEAEYAYADFDRYKQDILYAEPDDLPDDDFRYGLRRAVEIINKYKAESEE